MSKPTKKTKESTLKHFEQFDVEIQKYKKIILIDKSTLNTTAIQTVKGECEDCKFINLKGSIFRKLYKIDDQPINVKGNFIICLCNNRDKIANLSFNDYLIAGEKAEDDLVINTFEMKNRSITKYLNDNKLEGEKVVVIEKGQSVTKKQVELSKILKFKGITRKLNILNEYETSQIKRNNQ